MRAGTYFLVTTLLFLPGCMESCMIREPVEKPLDPNPNPEDIRPERIGENIQVLGENVPLAKLNVALDGLVRAGRHAEPYLFEALKSENARRRSNVLYVLRFSTNPEVIKHIAPLLKDPVFEVVLEAAAVLVEWGHKDGIPFLIRGLRHKDTWIREIAVKVLRRASRQYFGFHANDPRDRREFSAKKWEDWWKKQGGSFSLSPRSR